MRTLRFLCHFPRMAETWSKFTIILHLLLCCFSEMLKHPGPFIKEMEFSLLPLPTAIGSPWGCPGFVSDIAQSPFFLEHIYPVSPICRYLCLYLCMCVCTIYVVCGNSKCYAPVFPEASRRGDGIWLELNHTRILSMYYRQEGQENEEETLFCGLTRAIRRETL